MKKTQQLKFFKATPTFKIVKEEFTTLLSDKYLKRGLQLSMLLLSLNFLTLAILIWKLPPQLPLFYSRPWGEEQLVSKQGFIILPLTCLVFTLINLRLAGWFYKKEVLLSHILTWSSLLICLLATITFIKIIVIVL